MLKGQIGRRFCTYFPTEHGRSTKLITDGWINCINEREFAPFIFMSLLNFDQSILFELTH